MIDCGSNFVPTSLVLFERDLFFCLAYVSSVTPCNPTSKDNMKKRLLTSPLHAGSILVTGM